MTRHFAAGLAATTAIFITGAATAQDAKRIAELESRVAELEQAQAAQGTSRPRLKFNVTSNTELEIYGFARFEAFYDFDTEQGDLTRTSRIGDPAFATDGEFETSVRVSRLGFRSKTATDIGEIGTQLEFDLFSGSDTTTSPNPRLRHANVTIDDRWLFGQFWTNFMPLVHYPTTADFNGPVGITFARVPQVRYTHKAGNGFTFSGSIEEANGGSSDPILTAAALYEADRFSLRAAGLYGTFSSGGLDFDTSGFTLSGAVTPWEGGQFAATFVTGQGLGNLLIGGGAQAVDGQANDATGFTLAFNQAVTDTLTIGVAYVNESYDLATTTSTGATFTDLETVHMNVFYRPIDNLTLGAEYIRGQRTDATGTRFEADRIGASITYSF